MSDTLEFNGGSSGSLSFNRYFLVREYSSSRVFGDIRFFLAGCFGDPFPDLLTFAFLVATTLSSLPDPSPLGSSSSSSSSTSADSSPSDSVPPFFFLSPSPGSHSSSLAEKSAPLSSTSLSKSSSLLAGGVATFFFTVTLRRARFITTGKTRTQNTGKHKKKYNKRRSFTSHHYAQLALQDVLCCENM
uniref:(northern house mosquito) hypothetical protein n=1 Tax=Culex pipiens TaxID=7175 RepID=A0A8D8BNI9_CULPI